MRQERLSRRPRAGVKQRPHSSGGVGTIISSVLKKRNGISRSAPRLLCTLEPGVDTRLKFTIEPSIGKNGFQQWYDALKAVARLPTGIPKEWRKRVWLTLADQYLHSISIDWEKTLRFAFNERSNPDDDSLGIQIVKDLHRTGCSSYCGQEGEQDRVVLKRVLLAYARWNKKVGYCQGFNVLAALILEVTEGIESDALKVMIYLIDKVLPESYFANNLRALSVDMAVFRDLLRLKLPRLSQHLQHLQKAANKEAGGSYEPPLTNVFTMQWFLTMFATCLPAPTVLKIWDSVFFEGSEVLFRVALAIWERLGERIEYCQTADEFYSTMGCLTQEMLEHNLIDPTDVMHEVYSMAVFPFPQLTELREKYTYNITPFPTSVKSNGSGGLGSWESDDDADMDDEDAMVTALGCLGPLGGLLAPELQRYQKHLKEQRSEHGNIAELSPGAVGGAGSGAGRSEHQAAINSMMMERMTTDIYALKKQYARIKKRQQQQSMQLCIRTDKCPATRVTTSQLSNSAVINHLLLGQKPRPARLSSSSSSTTSSSPVPMSARAAPPRPRAHFQASPSSSSSTTGSSSRTSPWRDHVRTHRRNVARARAQLGFQDSRGTQEDEGEEDEEGDGRKKDRESEGRDEKDGGREASVGVSRNGCGMVKDFGDIKEDDSKEGRKDGESERRNAKNVENEPSVGVSRNSCGMVKDMADIEEDDSKKGREDSELEGRNAKDVENETLVRISRNSYEKAKDMADIEEDDSKEGREDGESEGRNAKGVESESSGRVSSKPIEAENDEDIGDVEVRLRALDLEDEGRSENGNRQFGNPAEATQREEISDREPSAKSEQNSPFANANSRSSPAPTDRSWNLSPHATATSPPPSLKSSSSVDDLPRAGFSYRTPCPSTPASLWESSKKSNMASSPSTPALGTLGASSQPAFSPFPCVKQPRKSAAARNLGLYGPTAKTPTVLFPHMSRSLSAATGRR